LLSPTTKAVADVADNDAASRVVSIVQSELQALASSSGGWANFTNTTNGYLRLAASVSSFDDSISATAAPATYKAAYLAAPYVFFASKDGGKVGNYASTVWGASGASDTEKDKDKFFEITLIRNWDTASSTGLSSPTNDSTAGYLAYTIRLRWPAFLPSGVRVGDNSQKSVLIVPAAVTR
jgi:hypothetical protein